MERSFFGRPEPRRWSTIFIAAISLALIAGWLATNASLSAAGGQYNPGVFVKSTAHLSKDGTEVTVTGTASCSPAYTGDLGIWVVQGANQAAGTVTGGATCGPQKTSFSGTASTTVFVSPPSGPLSKGPALVTVSGFDRHIGAYQVPIDLR